MLLVWRVLSFWISSGHSIYTFSNKSELRAALESWDRVAATGEGAADLTARYGDIASWNVSRVKDLGGMFANLGFFNEDISSWNVTATNMSWMFSEARAFNQPLDSWDVSRATDMSYLFSGARAFNQPLNSWNTSTVTNMQYMFKDAQAFNQPISSWDTSAVKTMSGMFYRAARFNQPVDAWDISSVVDLGSTFSMAKAFNQPLNSWNTSLVRNMRNMFQSADEFNKPISAWSTSRVTDMRGMFVFAKAFDQPLGSWNTSAVRDMSSMFQYAAAFNQKIGLWTTTAVTNMNSMFYSAKAFNQPLALWDTSAVIAMKSMFHSATAFNQPISSWNTSAVEDMSFMFYGAASFCQALHKWNTSSVRDASFMFCRAKASNAPVHSWNTASMTKMKGMFDVAESFNQDISKWDTSAVMDMSYMFSNARAFNSPIGSWNTSAVTKMSNMFYNATAFNQPIGRWDTSGVKVMTQMFYAASSFQQPLATWDTSAVVQMRYMFDFSAFHRPPCRAGFAPPLNQLGCEACAPGHYAGPGARICELCPPGTVPENRTTCKTCPRFYYAPRDGGDCQACNLPCLVFQDACIWWHIPLIALAVGCLSVLLKLFAVHRRSRKAKDIAALMDTLYHDLWDETPDIVSKYVLKLQRLGSGAADIEKRLAKMRALQSCRAGVGLRYLLSDAFLHQARQRTGLDNPTFLDMKTAFWLAEDPIGRDIPCPRDGRPGCALVDWISRKDRREQTHFMSWTWKYSVMQVRSALETFQAAEASASAKDAVFFYMCFFVNNQYRIIVEELAAGSDNLENVFEDNLRRIGRMVAILDTYDEPVYLSRIWTVYEQFIASKLEIPVIFVMPETSASLLQQQISRGDAGIREVMTSVSRVDSEGAEAWKEEDAQKVKSMIRDTVGFQHVDKHVTDVMLRWIGDVLKRSWQGLVDSARDSRAMERDQVASWQKDSFYV